MKSVLLIKIGQNIRRIRQGQSISQEELARKARIDRTYMGGIERGERNSTVQILERISKALSVPLDKLLN
jgi:transcriptional regulator with XRE-family HTH domain